MLLLSVSWDSVALRVEGGVRAHVRVRIRPLFLGKIMFVSMFTCQVRIPLFHGLL